MVKLLKTNRKDWYVLSFQIIYSIDYKHKLFEKKIHYFKLSELYTS